MNNLKELRERANKATQNFYSQHDKMPHHKNYLIGVDHSEEEPFVIADMNRYMDNWENDIKFIVAAKPTTILSLLDTIAELTKDKERLEWMIENAYSTVENTVSGKWFVARRFNRDIKFTTNCDTPREAIDDAMKESK